MRESNKRVLVKGLKFLAAALPLSFLGPVMMFSSFKNQEHVLFIPVLIISAAAMIAAGFFMFKGIKTIMNSIFD